MSQPCGKSGNTLVGITVRFYKIAPNWRWPARIIGAPADDMKMKLRHDVANRGKVDFADGKFILYKTRSDCRFGDRYIPHVFGQVEQIICC